MNATQRTHRLAWPVLLSLAVVLAGPIAALAQPADSAAEAKELYEQARRQIRRENYRRAAEAFREVHEDHPRSDYAADALYWEAFALYKLENDDGLRRALDLLEEQERHFPSAYEDGDGEFLATRVRRMLAEIGDLDAAEHLAVEAEKLAAREAREAARAEARRARETRHEAEESQRQEAETRAHEHGRSAREDDIRLTALEALLQMDSDRAVPILKDVLERRDPESAELRAKAIFVLSQKQTEETAQVLMDVARNDPDPEVRGQAIFWMSQVPGDESLDLLAEILKSEENEELQEQAAFAVSQHEDPRAGEILRDLAADETRDPELRGQAVFWLGQQSPEESFDFLQELYPKLESPEVKEQVLFAMSQNGGDRALDWMFDLARDRDEPMELRGQAVFWLGQSRHLPVDELRQLYDSAEDLELREQVIFALSQLGEEAVDLLIEIARNDPDPELRKHAIFWLSQTGDDRAVDALVDMINEGRQR